jgi:BirA family biotin operon repressor/biotin-[acetyl-CoA-carboxylase] ligase
LSVEKKGFDDVLDEWRRYSVTLGQEVNVIGVKETFAGTATDIDADGALLIDTPEGRRRVLAGDVSIRPRRK